MVVSNNKFNNKFQAIHHQKKVSWFTTLIEDVNLLDGSLLRGSLHHSSLSNGGGGEGGVISGDVKGSGGSVGSVGGIRDSTGASGSVSGIGSSGSASDGGSAGGSGTGSSDSASGSSGSSTVRTSPDDIFVVFSTDCTTYQDWQSLVLFYSAKLVRQPGVITRIASGCDESAIIALLDPDMVFLRPITRQIASKPYLIDKPLLGEVMENITIGRPVGQLYGLGAPWAKESHRYFNKYRICGEDSPCVKPTVQYGELHYSVGPPYVMVKEDFVRIAETWTRLVPRVYADYPFLLAEMYAYSMAAAHEKLPHLQVNHYMISNLDSGYTEGWKWIDDLPQVCIPAKDGVYYPDHNLPTVAHFCQSYRVGEFMFTKRRVPHNIFECDQPLFIDLPSDIVKNNFFYQKNEKKEFKDARYSRRNAFMVCIAYDIVNQALLDYKQKICKDQSTLTTGQMKIEKRTNKWVVT
eukprot:scaffold4368_cov180-Ochromonas_danica.AAC.13